MNKKIYKYAFMLMVLFMGAVAFSSCCKNDDGDVSGDFFNGGGSAVATNGTMVIDGTTYKINIVEISSKGYKIDFVCNNGSSKSKSDAVGMQIKTVDKTVFPTSLSSVNCEVEVWVGTQESQATNVPVQCSISNGTLCNFILNNANINGHTVSLYFNDDASKYTE